MGSVCRYFPAKRPIFVALYDRHVNQIARLIESTAAGKAAEPFDDLVRALIEALVGAHVSDA